MIFNSDGNDSASKTSTIYDREYFESKMSLAYRGVKRACVFSITLTGPLGLLPGGVRNFFEQALRDYSTNLEIKWNREGTKIRVIMVNFKDGEKMNVKDKLSLLVKEGAQFVFTEKTDERFGDVVEGSVFREGIGVGGERDAKETPPQRTTPEKMKLLVWGGNICHNTGCQTIKNLMSCSSCKLVKYCSKYCQRSHWRQHKLKCVESLKK
jgi:hypothetical protein